MTPVYVNQPGGIIVQMKNGESKGFTYGQEIPTDEVADHVDLSGFADNQRRNTGLDEQLVRESHERAALAEARSGGQATTGQTPVPSNYDELEEDGAVRVVQALARVPESQAAVLVHEIVYCGGRQKVLDAATNYARISAQVQIEAEVQSVRNVNSLAGAPSIVPLGDPDILPGSEAQTKAFTERADALAAQLQGRTPPPTTRAGDTLVRDPQNPDATATNPTPAPEGTLLLDPDGNPTTVPNDVVEPLLAAGYTQPDESEQAAIQSRHGSSPDGGEAGEWDAENTSHDAITAYASQHSLDIPGKDKASRAERIEAIKAYEGHEKPVTPLGS